MITDGSNSLKIFFNKEYNKRNAVNKQELFSIYLTIFVFLFSFIKKYNTVRFYCWFKWWGIKYIKIVINNYELDRRMERKGRPGEMIFSNVVYSLQSIKMKMMFVKKKERKQLDDS